MIKVAGAAGYGSPYPPQQVAVEVFAEATGGDPGVWANATVIPGMGQPALISGIYWNTRSDVTLTPASNETVSVETIFDGGSLVVFYVSYALCLQLGPVIDHLLTMVCFPVRPSRWSYSPFEEGPVRERMFGEMYKIGLRQNNDNRFPTSLGKPSFTLAALLPNLRYHVSTNVLSRCGN